MEKLENKEEKNWPYYKDKEIRDKIDSLLKENSILESSLGKDSTEKEKIKAKVKQDRLFGKIRKLDINFYNRVIGEEL